MKKKPVLHTLYIEDTEDKQIQKLQKEWMETEFEDNYRIIHKTTSIMSDGGTTAAYLEKLKRMIQEADVITFDYGGFQQMASWGAGYSIVDYWNRFFVQQISDHPNKDWRCVSNLETFEDDDRKLLEELGVKFRW